ncbi:hypothetical protein [Methylomarinum vadi]|uniref:hypothetical protein n=1 Tax=Methylomarinum vadi TaxID=438855 RepID=UPI0004DF19B3|nr:hypothetical protein [Methylomarinum vadi]
MFTLLGFFYEQSGQNQLSLENYKQYQRLGIQVGGFVSDEFVYAALHRIMATNRIEAFDAVLVRQDDPRGPLKKGDIILRLNQQNNINSRLVRDLFVDRDITDYRVNILRNGEILEMAINHPILYIRDVVLPAEIASAETMPQRRQILFHEWIGKLDG